ncbi:MAG: hypothetical protein KAT76_01010, partial [Bacteroidales bacterium]|nr:hypothetical protein [Bacteroidales bacterium]
AFVAFIFIFMLVSRAQEENLSKNNKQRNQQKEIIYEPLADPVPIDDFHEGGGGYSPYFYYGDLSGIYLSEAWENGSAGLIDETALSGSFRYNIYLQKMEAVIEGDTFAFAKSCELEWVRIGDSKFIYSNFVRSDHEVANTWFEVLCEGECELLLRRYIKYRVTDGDDNKSNDQLYRLEEYYTRKGEGEGERMYMSKKSILSHLKSHEGEINDYLKSEKLKLKNHDDLVKLFVYYNTLD